MTIIKEFLNNKVLRKTETFSVVSGVTTLPSSGSITMAPCFIVTSATSDVKVRLRLYSTNNIMNATDSNVLSEKARQFGSTTGSTIDSPVFGDLIMDVDVDQFGTTFTNPPLFGVPDTGNSVYYYLQEGTAVANATEATQSALTGQSGDFVLNYTQLTEDTGSIRISQSVVIPNGDFGISGSFTISEIYNVVSASIEYTSGGGGSGMVNGSRLRIYQDEASMNAEGEIDREFVSPTTASFQGISGNLISPFSGSGLVIDIWFSSSLSGPLNPLVMGSNMYITPTTQSWYRYEATASVPADGTAEFTLQVMELL
ncbi:MAG: hypothetical protein VW683_01625 [Betaproteobacteria bacterium]|jgi:hypothetical protein